MQHAIAAPALFCFPFSRLSFPHFPHLYAPPPLAPLVVRYTSALNSIFGKTEARKGHAPRAPDGL